MSGLIAIITTLLIVPPAALFWLRMFRDIPNNHRLPSNAKFTWMLMFVCLNVFGAALYFFESRRRY